MANHFLLAGGPFNRRGHLVAETREDHFGKTGAGPPGGSLGYVYLLTSVAALGGLLFGYDTAVISGTIGFVTAKRQAFRFSVSKVVSGRSRSTPPSTSPRAWS